MSDRRLDPRATLRAEIDALPSARRSRRPSATSITTDFLPGAYGAVLEASRVRRMSLQAYLRRAALAFAAHDLGIPVTDLLERDPRVARETGFSVEDEAGTRFGSWEIGSLVGEVRDDE